MKNWICLLALIIPTALFGQRTWDTIPFVPDHYSKRFEEFKKEPIVTGKIIFLGNSITEFGNWKTLLKDSSVINRGISGDITFGVLNRLDEVIRRKPSKLFLLIGVNDLAKGIPTEVVVENILSIAYQVKKKSPKTDVYVQSILPTNNTLTKQELPNHVKNNDKIVFINGQLQKFAEKMKYTFVDLHPKFLNPQGQLDMKFSNDGLHLNAAGYQIWITTLKNLKCL